MKRPGSATQAIMEQAEGPVGPRTSASHPLRIDEVPAGRAGGLIGLTLCPGKRDFSISGARWERDLPSDLDAIAAWRAETVLTLIEDHEFVLLEVRGLPEGLRERGMAWIHLPIQDGRAPDHRFEAAWPELAPRLQRRLRAGGRLLVHCRGGLGRSGVVAALLLIGLRHAPASAVQRVRAARPGAIETEEQLRYVLAFRAGRPPPAP